MLMGTEKPSHFEISEAKDEQVYPHFEYDFSGQNLPPLAESHTAQGSSESEEAVFAVIDELIIKGTPHEEAPYGLAVKPEEESLRGYKSVLESGQHAIGFSPASYPAFDKIISDICGVNHPAFSKQAVFYSYYLPLRINLAILRNYLMLRYSPKVSAINIATLETMARKLGEVFRVTPRKFTFMQRIALKILRLFKKKVPLHLPNRFLELANTPDRGIAFMHYYLCELQDTAAFSAAMPAAQMPKDWKLLPLEQTPFSGDNILRYGQSARMGQIADAFDVVVGQLHSINEMREQDRELSVEHAREILRNMRIIQTGAREQKSVDEIDTRIKEGKAMLEAAACFKQEASAVAQIDSSFLKDPKVAQATEAVEKIGYRAKSEHKSMLREENRPQAAQQVDKRMKKAPARNKTKEPVQQVAQRLENGLIRAAELRSLLKRQKQRAQTTGPTLNALGQPTQQSAKDATKVKQSVKDSLKDTMSVMSSPKISQVSNADPELLKIVNQANEPKSTDLQQKGKPSGRSVT